MPSTSIQYQISNSILLRRVFLKGDDFMKSLDLGKKSAIEDLLVDWENTREILKKTQGLEVKDIDKKVSAEDFDIYVDRDDELNPTQLFVTIRFPEYDYYDKTSRFVGILLSEDLPRYFTFEYDLGVNDRKGFTFGEYFFDYDTEKAIKQNYSFTINGRIEDFIKLVNIKLNGTAKKPLY